jgi:hypothetical protein
MLEALYLALIEVDQVVFPVALGCLKIALHIRYLLLNLIGERENWRKPGHLRRSKLSASNSRTTVALSGASIRVDMICSMRRIMAAGSRIVMGSIIG